MSLLTIAQTQPYDIMDILQGENLIYSIAVMVLWAIAFMYGWWAISGKEAVPRRLMAITFIFITLAAFILTFYLSPEMYTLARNNLLQFALIFLGSGAFGIVILPALLLMAIGALTGFIRRGS